jgi:hypothetical protein
VRRWAEDGIQAAEDLLDRVTQQVIIDQPAMAGDTDAEGEWDARGRRVI